MEKIRGRLRKQRDTGGGRRGECQGEGNQLKPEGVQSSFIRLRLWDEHKGIEVKKLAYGVPRMQEGRH